jgi:hypothetical protein
MTQVDWPATETEIARKAFHKRNERAVTVLIGVIQTKSQSLNPLESVCSLHDYLSTERYEIEGRMEFNYDTILFSLAEMMKRNLIEVTDLQGLDPKKVSKIKAMSLF